MRAIKLVKNTIDIPFVDENDKVIYTLSFDRTDENTKKLRKAMKELRGKIEEFDDMEETEENEEKAVLFLKETADSLLGEGSFDKMYKVNPFVYAVARYLYQAMIIIKEETEEEDLKAVESKYLG